MEVITTHINADFDTLASMIAAKKIYPDAKIVFSGGMEKGVRNFLKTFTIPGFSHTRLKSIDIHKIDRLILVDTRQKGRIGAFADIIDSGIDIHIYDHHPDPGDGIGGSIEITNPFGSTTAIMVKLLRERKLSLSPEEATAMMLGIYEDTGSLTFASTTEEDYQAAAWLLSRGADLNILSHNIRKEMSAEEVALLNELNNSVTARNINGQEIAFALASSENYMEDAALLINKMTWMQDADAVFSLIRMENKVYLIARSRSKRVDAGVVAAAFGGGGHPAAGSAAIKDMTLAEAEARLLEKLEEAVQEIKKAGDIMSSPVKEIGPLVCLKSAKELMAKLNINVFPVVKDKKTVGLISRQEIGKAIFHGLENSTVSEFMTSDFSTVDADSPISKAQEIIIEENQKFLPVMKNGYIAGCITRTDLLRVLHYDAKKREKTQIRHSHTKNLGGLLRGRLPAWIQDIIHGAGAKADELNVNAYLVGGFVRDLLLGRKNLDIDIVVEGDGISYALRLADAFNGRIKSHKKFGTAVVVLPDGFKVDVASARMEFYNKPATLPTVEAGPIKMDLYRRDFTINSMAIRLNKKGFGELLDYFGGARDIKEGAIRALHSLSFIEDPTRAFRAVRFEQRLGFHLGKQSLMLIKNAVRLDFFDKVSPSRIFGELKIILMEDEPLRTLKRMCELDILRFIHPKFSTNKDTEILFREIEKVLDWYDLLFKKERYEKWVILLAALQNDLNMDEVEKMAKDTGIAARHANKLREIKNVSDDIIVILDRKDTDDVSIYKALISLKVETCLFMMAKTGKNSVKEYISRFTTELKGIGIETKGKDIERLGIMPGPIYKEIKESLTEERLAGRIMGKDDETRYIKKRWLKRG